MSLYDLSKELVEVNNAIIEAGGELTEDLEKDLDRLSPAINEKAVNIGKWILNLGAEIPGIKAEIDRLTQKKRFAENLQKRVKTYLRDCMIAVDKKKIETPCLRITVQNTNPSVEIEDEAAIPGEYKTVETVIKIDKAALLRDLKAAEKASIPGARLVKDKKHLRIG